VERSQAFKGGSLARAFPSRGAGSGERRVLIPPSRRPSSVSSLRGWLEASRVKRGGQSRTVAVDDEQGNRLASALARLSV